jgi:hypothetical protein
MIRTSIFAGVLLSSLLGLGCEKDAQEQQQKAQEAQAEATKKTNEARLEADKKSAVAQAEANKKIAEAQAGFAKLIEDYRHKATTDLADLDKKVEVIDAKAQKASGNAKVDLDAKLAQIRASRETFVTSLKGLEGGRAETWDVARARVDVMWTDLKALVDKA